jgi:hypothetical protein
MNKKDGMVLKLIALFTLISLCFGVYFYFERRYALAQDLRKVENRLDYKIVSDQVVSIQERIWLIQDRCNGKPPLDDTVKEELRELEMRREILKDRLRRMEGDGSVSKVSR